MSERAHLPAEHKAAVRNHVQRLDKQDKETEWRSQKQIDIVSFNAGSEPHFVDWLRRQIKASKTGTVEVSWILGNAAFEVDVSIPTIKRYLRKYTADAAPFKSTGKEIGLRR